MECQNNKKNISCNINIMSCIKILIKNEYRKLQHVVRTKINKDCMIDLVEENLVDMLMLYNYHFRNLSTDNYRESIDELFEMSDEIIEQSDRNLIYDDIYKFLVWLKELQKK